jgi:hypothetical protein
MKVERHPTQDGATVHFAVEECEAFVRVAHDADVAGIHHHGESLNYLQLSVRLGSILQSLASRSPHQVAAAAAALAAVETVSRENVDHVGVAAAGRLAARSS